MPRTPIDLRSDTATRPTTAMRAAMAEAPVGDDVLAEDPTVNALEERIAAMLGKDSAMFVPSGTMSNQIGVRLHCRPGDEVILESGCHIYNHEQGGVAQLSALATRTVDGRGGMLQLEQLEGLLRPDNMHYVRSRLLCLENTHNRAGGAVLPLAEVERVCGWAHEHGLGTHLDGARLFNAVVATGISAERWARSFDTVSVCFSKGLGAPVGSAICGSKELMRDAKRHRKLFGGGMRQAGIIAAGALYAL
ncbi:MAG TPA: GntG family PLP-dependent aldolase, partial [Pirellulales bacterium]|nr:GntG family PLP-dependent aldolase [Pirellulales bacterium]